MVQKILAALVALTVSAGSAMAVSPEAQQLIDRAAADCQSIENGEFDQGDAVTEIELRSQFGTVNAELVDESQYACSSRRVALLRDRWLHAQSHCGR